MENAGWTRSPARQLELYRRNRHSSVSCGEQVLRFGWIRVQLEGLQRRSRAQRGERGRIESWFGVPRRRRPRARGRRTGVRCFIQHMRARIADGHGSISTHDHRESRYDVGVFFQVSGGEQGCPAGESR